MALADLLKLSSEKGHKIGISEERVRAQMLHIRNYIAYWREYPDMFVEFLCGDNPENFELYFSFS